MVTIGVRLFGWIVFTEVYLQLFRRRQHHLPTTTNHQAVSCETEHTNENCTITVYTTMNMKTSKFGLKLQCGLPSETQNVCIIFQSDCVPLFYVMPDWG
uniref:Uncharacterized protein n=1 Tax=Oryza brachyantha TaxID=4533 RepID=J3M1Y3_ORYBR